MQDNAGNPLSFGQIQADLFVAQATIKKAEELSSKAGKYYRGQTGYHLQQAAEKLIKIQIYESGVTINNAKMYRHSLDDLISYAESLGFQIIIPKWVNEKKYLITSWEAEGRYELDFAVRIDTLKRALLEINEWEKELKAVFRKNSKSKI